MADATKGDRLERPATAAGPLRGVRGHLSKALQGGRGSKSPSPFQNNVDRSRDPRRQNMNGGSPKPAGPQDHVSRYEQVRIYLDCAAHTSTVIDTVLHS